MPAKLTKESFIKKATELYNGKFKYDEVEYVDRNTKVKIWCPKHGYFEQAPREHLHKRGEGCPKCGIEKNGKRNLSSKEEFIKRAREVHGDCYDYSLVNYVNARTKVDIVCPKHGVFSQTPDSHINRAHGCPHCKWDKRRVSLAMTGDEFFAKMREKYGDMYDMSKSVYVDVKTPVTMYCPKHDREFSNKPPLMLKGNLCPDCGRERQGSAFQKTHDEFIEQANKKHNFKYDYSLVNYKSSEESIPIICHEIDEFTGEEHGVFWQKATAHVNGYGCPKCSGRYRLTTETFIKKANMVHNNGFDYSKVDYKNSHEHVLITCKKCGETFPQLPYDHLNGRGCPYCAQSNLEQLIYNKLKESRVLFKKEKRFKELGALRFDFFLPEYDVLIECQGVQHFRDMPTTFMNRVTSFSDRVANDIKKFRFAKENGYNLYYLLCQEKIDYAQPIFEGIYTESMLFKNHNELVEYVINHNKKNML